jgi:hypothetical protein
MPRPRPFALLMIPLLLSTLSCGPKPTPVCPVAPTLAPVTVIKAKPPCNLPDWPALATVDGTSLPNGAKVVDVKTGQAWDASPGSAILPKETLAKISAYVHGTRAYYDFNELCRKASK